MKTLSKLIALAAVIAVAGISELQAQSTIVYDNTTTDLGLNFEPATGNIVGDQVILTGTDRTITDFSFQYWGTDLPANAEVILTFYANDGEIVDGAASPGTMLYQSTPYTIGNTARSSIQYSTSLGDLNGGVVVPNSFTWTVTFNNLGSGHAGLTLYSPPTTGNNYNDYWINTGSGWQLMTYGSPVNFAAQIAAVPEPSSMALLGLGGLALAWKRRQKK